MPADSPEFAQFKAHIHGCPIFAAAFRAISPLGMPNWFVSGTGVAQTYWNVAHGRPYLQGLHDLDIVYFDAEDLTVESEQAHERTLAACLREFPVPVDVKNQARVHLWYAERHGYAIQPYQSIEHAIKTFPTPAGAVCVRERLSTAGTPEIDACAPFGLSDVLTLKIRPNKTQITREFYEKKARSYKERWPMLEIVPW